MIKGFSLGMSGSYTFTEHECVLQSEKLIKEILGLGSKITKAVTFTGSILDPFYAAFDALVTTSNY